MAHTIRITFPSSGPWRLYIKFYQNWPSGCRGEIRNCGQMKDDGRPKRESAYTIRSVEAFGLGWIKSKNKDDRICLLHFTEAPAESMELLENTGMESNFTDNWSCHTDCTLEASNDSYRGAMSAKVTNR